MRERFREEPSVSFFEMWLLALMVIGLVVGGCGIVWTRVAGSPSGIYMGRGLFIGTLLFLGASTWLAARHRADGLAPLGLSAGFLVIFMLWEAPSTSSDLFPVKQQTWRPARD
jgi:hypothetical protein